MAPIARTLFLEEPADVWQGDAFDALLEMAGEPRPQLEFPPPRKDRTMRYLSLSDSAAAELWAALQHSTGEPPAAPVATLPADPTVNNPLQHRIDPVLPAGSPGTVVLPVTGRVMPQPEPQNHEGLLGYAERTSKITGLPIATIGGLVMLQSGMHNTDWPQMVDEYSFIARGLDNPYVTAAERASADAAHQRDLSQGAQWVPPAPSNTVTWSGPPGSPRPIPTAGAGAEILLS